MLLFLGLLVNMALAVAPGAKAATAIDSEPRLVSSGPEGVVVEISARDYRLRRVVLDGQTFDRVDLSGAVWPPEPGAPAVPMRGVLLGAPEGAAFSVEVVDGDYDEVSGVDLMPVPETTFAGRADLQFVEHHYEPDRAIYGQDRFYPAQQAAITRTGLMRDQRVVGVSLRPVQYNPVRKILRIARRLRVRVRFRAQGPSRPLLRPVDGDAGGVFEPIYRKALLNAEQARAWRGGRFGGRDSALRKLQADWYDPSVTYYKVRIREDGIYRLDAEWFAASGIDLGAGDLERLKLYLNGVGVALEVRDGGDGRLDAGDGVFFYGQFRRAPDRNFENELGRANVYWLTLDGNSGRRLQPVEAEPRSGFVEAARFTAVAHAEVDSLYDPLGGAVDALRDHWYWGRTGSPLADLQEFPVTVPVVLPGLDRAFGGRAGIRVAIHGLTFQRFEPDHRTVVRLASGTVVTDDRWDGQTAFIAGGEAPVSELEDTTRVTLATPGAADFPEQYVDAVLLNWVEIAYPRRYEAVDGTLLFDFEEAEGRSLSIGGFRTSSISVYDLEGGGVLEGIEVAQDGAGYRARFEVEGGGGRFLAVDSEAVRRPDAAQMDAASNLRGERGGADYVIVTHTLFREEAERLADHRRAGGLSAQVVDVADIYDEFAFGQLNPEAVRTFMVHAFGTWTRRPVYLLLFGRASFDYRDIFDQARHRRRNFVPGLPFQRSRRGLAFTDHLFGTVAGEDAFLDVFVGRFSVTSAREAETVVQKVMGYDQAPPARWRDRILYMANFEPVPIFVGPSDSLAALYAEPLGLETFKVYNDEDTPPAPNEDTREVIRQINEGRLVMNFMGHGSAAIMASFIRGTFQQQNYNYMVQIVNEDRLPLMIAMSCLNGLYADPTLICLAEEMTKKPDGGAIAYVSASSLTFISTNNFINEGMFKHMFRDSIRSFGPSLALAKADWLAVFPLSVISVYGMNLMGDPAQALAVPPGPDFSLPDDGLKLSQRGELTAGDSTRIAIRVENLGILSEAGPEAVLVDWNLDRAEVDTLFRGVLPPFGQADSLGVLWRLRAGRHRLEVVLDPADRIEELDETNNRLELELDVFGALTAVPTMPRQSQAVSASGVRLAARAGTVGEGEVLGEFEVSRTPIFEGAEVTRSGTVGGEDGLVSWQPSGLTAGIYYWRVRLSDGQDRGAWTAPQEFVVASSAPEREVLWQQRGAEAYGLGTPKDVTLFEDGSVGRVLEPPPMRFNPQTREEAFAAAGVTGTAVLCTDGTYVYVKRFSDSPRAYPGTDVFERIGTGFGGTVAGQNYGVLTEVSIKGISATYHSDGFIYADDGRREELVRISPVTGAVDRMRVPDGLLEVRTGLVFSGHSLITSDGVYIYNVSWGVNGIRRAGWTVRVFDPEDGWRVVREFRVDPTSTGFSYLFTDGVIADGRYLYLVEFGTGLTHRVRVVDAQDGRFVAEYESDQAETDILSGQYDWVNNQVWFGQLNGPMVYRYTGRRLPDSGSLTSGAIGPAGAWGTLRLALRPGGTTGARAEVDILGESPSGGFFPLPAWTGLSPGSEIDLSGLDASRIQLRVRLFGEDLTPSPGLTEWAVGYQPLSDLGLSGLRAEPTVVEEVVPVTLTVDVLNRGPLDLVLGTAIGFYSGFPESGRLIGRTAVPEGTSFGSKTPVLMVWNTAKFGGRHLVTARVEDLLGRPSIFDQPVSAQEPVEVTPSGDQDAPEVALVALDAAGELRPEDFLPSEPRFQVIFTDSSGIDPASVQILLTGTEGEVSEGISSPAVQDRLQDRTSLGFVYAPTLEDDRYVLEVSARDQVGNGPAQKSLAFRVSSELQIEKALNVPNPMADGTAFTYILSRPAEVTVRIYTVFGRLVQVLENLPGRAGFNQAFWDGRDGDGHPLANGVYLYTVTAEDGFERARVKERLVVYRR